ncbi:hypothetical protein GCM10010331_49120 [Streptomyces xanthochromogenes]|uniref:hypothetical protein n=1 Tax=Streptomyces xanthochromogenes TaxID=67384 RepID=UPI0016768E2F|nr:hypothetical protein [Streptomyces xanthochromogenes]GHB55469.1 hypothetical protein GCM10010331_49120 [Streptomyces xanthochromogenes]
MARIRKAAAGSDSFGHTWTSDGAIVEIEDPDQIAALLAIDDAGFSEVTPEPEAGPVQEPDLDLDAAKAHNDDPERAAEFSEIDPKAEDSEVDPRGEDVEAPKPARRGGRKPASAQE